MRAFRPALAVTALAISIAVSPLVLLEAAAQSWPQDTWPVSTPQKEGIDPKAIDALLADMKAGKYGLLNHFLLIRHGRVVADRHFEHDYKKIAAKYDHKNHQYNYDHPAWHPYYRDTRLHTLQSVTKEAMGVGPPCRSGLLQIRLFEHGRTSSRPKWRESHLQNR